ncbi:LIC10707 family hydrolase [Leptospira stimsonii]|uniref:SGNH/GDSL hydrolase family protein n=1 Tax=Leptospira stimsonii TaxID=2202203 RepID=A0A396Z0U9_9LEPT|nr:SGNH/GDSL hydrolase family protein [Leptospira stimsonii]RHX89141.1 SGNH/GDSL hydrolase family protein [Leptospira stimsonii]
MKKNTFNSVTFKISLFILIYSNTLLADKNSITFWFPDENHTYDHLVKVTNCNTQFDDNNPESFEPNKTFLTMYGDSLGDFVNEGAYGYFGWDKFLTLMNFGIEWNVQNLAIGGYTTNSVYNLITKCAESDVKRFNFKTAPNVAFEIGGNDFWHNSLMLTFMPWKFPSVVDRVIYNTKAILFQLRHPRRDKDVLVMGNFPNLSYSPTLGNYSQYFNVGAVQPGYNFTSYMNQLHDSQATALHDDTQKAILTLLPPFGWLALLYMPIDLDKLQGDFAQAIVGIKQAYNEALSTIEIQTGLDELNVLHSQIKNSGISPTGKDEWYWIWLHTIKNNISMISSIGMFLTQGPLEQLTNEMNVSKGKVHFLPMYHLFIRQKDCFEFGQCWVANPWLYQDPVGHLNYLGYTVWASALSAKVIELDWHNSLKNGPPKYNGAVSIPGDDTVITLPDGEHGTDEVVIVPSEIDLLLLICLFTGKCW